MEKALVEAFAIIVSSSIRHLQEPELLSSIHPAQERLLTQSFIHLNTKLTLQQRSNPTCSTVIATL